MRRRITTLLTGVGWTYPRPVTTVAVLVLALIGTLLARALLPESWRPDGAGWVVLAALCAYVALRLGAWTGWTKRFKHELLDRLGGDVDDAQTWLFATLVGGGVLALVALVQRS